MDDRGKIKSDVLFLTHQIIFFQYDGSWVNQCQVSKFKKILTTTKEYYTWFDRLFLLKMPRL